MMLFREIMTNSKQPKRLCQIHFTLSDCVLDPEKQQSEQNFEFQHSIITDLSVMSVSFKACLVGQPMTSLVECVMLYFNASLSWNGNAQGACRVSIVLSCDHCSSLLTHSHSPGRRLQVDSDSLSPLQWHMTVTKSNWCQSNNETKVEISLNLSQLLIVDEALAKLSDPNHISWASQTERIPSNVSWFWPIHPIEKQNKRWKMYYVSIRFRSRGLGSPICLGTATLKLYFSQKSICSILRDCDHEETCRVVWTALGSLIILLLIITSSTLLNDTRREMWGLYVYMCLF